MLNLIHNPNVYLAAGATDLRKSIDGLALLVSHAFDLDPFSQNLFVFCNKQRDKIKILVWEQNGFWLCYKRLEKGRFQWPKSTKNQAIALTRRELQWLLDGLNIEQKQAHKPVAATKII